MLTFVNQVMSTMGIGVFEALAAGGITNEQWQVNHATQEQQRLPKSDNLQDEQTAHIFLPSAPRHQPSNGEQLNDMLLQLVAQTDAIYAGITNGTFEMTPDIQRTLKQLTQCIESLQAKANYDIVCDVLNLMLN